MTDEPGELAATLNAIREEKFEHIPEELVNQIIQIEHETLEDRETTQEKISDIVESYLEEVE